MIRTIKKIISGGQTGVDRAALDFAIQHHIPHSGYCPKGRRAEDGRIPDFYQLTETSSERYEERTERNLLESDGTLILDMGSLSGGTALTVELCLKHLKPIHIIDMNEMDESTGKEFWAWVSDNFIHVLNVAGSRESKRPVYARSRQCLEQLFNVKDKKFVI